MLQLKLTKMVPSTEHILLTNSDLSDMLDAVLNSDLDKNKIKVLSNKLNKLIDNQYEQ